MKYLVVLLILVSAATFSQKQKPVPLVISTKFIGAMDRVSWHSLPNLLTFFGNRTSKIALKVKFVTDLSKTNAYRNYTKTAIDDDVNSALKEPDSIKTKFFAFIKKLPAYQLYTIAELQEYINSFWNVWDYPPLEIYSTFPDDSSVKLKTDSYDLSKFDSISISFKSNVRYPSNSELICKLGSRIIYRIDQDSSITVKFTQPLEIISDRTNTEIAFELYNDISTDYTLSNLKIIGWK